MPENPPPLEPGATGQPPRLSLWSRLINIFAAPGEAFDSIRERPVEHANWLVPVIALVVVGWLGAALIFSQDSFRQQMREASEKAIDRQIAAQHMPAAQAEQVRQAAEKFGRIGQTFGFFVGPAATAFATPFFLGLLYWVVAQQMLRAPLPYLKLVEVTGLATMIAILEAVVRILLIFATGRLMVTPSLGLFIHDFDPANPLHTLALFVNPFTFWILSVRAIGLARVAGSSFAKAACWVFGIWCAYSGFLWVVGWLAQQVARKTTG